MSEDKMEKYFQTWHWNARLKRHCKWLALLWQWLCGKITGHELSKTEKGYGGERYIDHWCRWCNKLIKVPKEESTWAEEYKDLIDEVDKGIKGFE